VAERANQSIEHEIKQLEKELASAHDKLDEFRVENERLVNRCNGLEAASQIETSNATRVTQELRVALHAARTDVESRNQKLDRRDAQIRTLQQEIERPSARNSRTLEAKVQETESALALSRRDLEIANNQLNAVSDQMAQLSSLLKDRTFELKGAQSFLTTADTSSGADVISMLQRLNSEILQSAAYMAESMVDAFPFQLGRLRDEDACEVVRRSLGSLIAHYLATKKHKNDPLLIQIAFQTSFVQILKYVIGSWSLSSDDANAIYTNTYERIRVGGES
jgi:DNA repair exonuclease SbcCD ATPase subunit